MTITTRGAVPLRDAFYQLSLAKSVPDAETLDEFIRRYPEHSTALTEFAIALALDSFGKVNDISAEPRSQDTSPAVSRAMSRFHNRLYAVKTSSDLTSAPAELAENPFVSLRRSELRSLADRLNVNSVFIMKLRDRQIRFDTIPFSFQQRVAAELELPVGLLAAHLAAQSEVSARTYFKADEKPEASAKQTFEEAVRGSGLTSEQQHCVLGL